MLTRAQEKLIKSLHTNKGRKEAGLCLVEGEKVIETAGKAVDFSFTSAATDQFEKLVTTETPQGIAAVAKIPKWSLDDVQKATTIVVLDNVQDPGNVGAILRLCLGFRGALILVESADVSSPKVIRSSVGAMFQVPWIKVSRKEADTFIQELDRPVFRLELREGSKPFSELVIPKEVVLIAGSEGQGIQLETKGISIVIDQDPKLESLNVGHALAISMHARYTNMVK